MDTKSQIDLLNSAGQVWDHLITSGGLDEKYYDTEIVADLRSRLNLPPGRDFSQLLKDQQVSTEDLIFAFFQAIQPFAEMMSDLLVMFEQAGAKQAANNLSIEFDFGSEQPPLKFDLDHFRGSLVTWKTVTGSFVQSAWNPENLWALNSALAADWNAPVDDQAFQHWNQEYRELGRWPEQLLPSPRSQFPDLDTAFSKMWRVWVSFVSACKQYGDQRTDVVNARYRSSEGSAAAGESAASNQAWPLNVLGSTESDFWAGSLARKAYHIAERISALPQVERSGQAQDVLVKLDKVFAQIPEKQFEGTSVVQSLLEFLNLPIWRKRHELYSAWISTQIVNAIPGSTRIHQLEGRLEFSFSGTHLATADDFDPRLHVWAELRSPLEKPRGKSREKAIQPDYSLITDPVSNPKSSILEVECKQYRRPSARNFSDALSDYARGRPNAVVVLVNYGKANQDILERVDPSVRERTCLIGDMRPGSVLAQQSFKRIVEDAIQKRYGQLPVERLGSKSVDITVPAQVVLSWSANPRDLDLYLHIRTQQGEYITNYQNTGNLHAIPWNRLDADVTSGSGPELIEVAQWIGGTYRLAINNFSKDRPLACCDAKLVFSNGERIWDFKCPDTGTGDWWLVMEIDGGTGRVEVINKIVSEPW
jgi:hypothetical protein